jgi:hypothetical protein
MCDDAGPLLDVIARHREQDVDGRNKSGHDEQREP